MSVVAEHEDVPDIIEPDDLEWFHMGGGNYVKFLRYSPKTGDYAFLTKMSKGQVRQRHRHIGTVNIYVVSGYGADWNGHTAPPGSWAYERDQALHESFTCADDTVNLCLGRSGGVDMLDDEGNVLAEFRVDEFVRTLPDSVRAMIEQD